MLHFIFEIELNLMSDPIRFPWQNWRFEIPGNPKCGPLHHRYCKLPPVSLIYQCLYFSTGITQFVPMWTGMHGSWFYVTILCALVNVQVQGAAPTRRVFHVSTNSSANPDDAIAYCASLGMSRVSVLSNDEQANLIALANVAGQVAYSFAHSAHAHSQPIYRTSGLA